MPQTESQNPIETIHKWSDSDREISFKVEVG